MNINDITCYTHTPYTTHLHTTHTYAIQQNQEQFECKTIEDIHKLLKQGVCANTHRLANGRTPLVVHMAAGNKYEN